MEKQEFGLFNNFTLKLIAVITMLIDHIGCVLFPGEPIFRAIGRISFPIFCFLIVEGFYHTRSHVNYLIRLCLFAILSEIPFDLTFFHTMADWNHQNVFITLALGLISIFCLEELNGSRIFVLPLILTWIAAYFSHCDYGIGGVLLICVFYRTKDMPLVRLILCALVLYIFFGDFELFALFSLIPIYLYNGKKGPSTGRIFYWFYPAHLLVLYFLQHYL